MDIQEIFRVIDALAPERNQSAWDNSGVQIAGQVRELDRVAVCLEPTPAMVGACLDWGAGLVVTHHPLSLEARPLDEEGPFLEVVRRVLAARAWLYAAHTSLDTRPGGPAFWLGAALELRNTAVLEPLAAGDPEPAGFGQIGDLPAPLAWEAFLARLAGLVGREVLSLAGPAPRTVARLAYCNGSGAGLAARAARAGADVFVTGDVKYHPAVEAPLCVVDVGHFSLEEEMTRLFAAELDQGLPGVEVRFFAGREPFRFYRVG